MGEEVRYEKGYTLRIGNEVRKWPVRPMSLRIHTDGMATASLEFFSSLSSRLLFRVLIASNVTRTATERVRRSGISRTSGKTRLGVQQADAAGVAGRPGEK